MERHEERIIRLEERFAHEKAMADFRLSTIARRLDRLERSSQSDLPLTSGTLKLLLAVGVTVVAFLAGGAPAVLRLWGGG